MGALVSDKPKWRSMPSFLKRPIKGASTASFVAEDKFGDQEIYVGDECGDCAEDEVCAQDDGSLDQAACQFDATVSVLQDILLDPSFEEVQRTFCRTHCHKFDDADENKLFYTDIFRNYQEVVEASLEQRLLAAVPNFSIDTFILILDTRRSEIMEELLDLLMSFVDFQYFKELMLTYKVEAVTSSIHVNVSKAVMHSEEQEDGEMRCDLDSELQNARSQQDRSVSPVIFKFICKGSGQLSKVVVLIKAEKAELAAQAKNIMQSPGGSGSSGAEASSTRKRRQPATFPSRLSIVSQESA